MKERNYGTFVGQKIEENGLINAGSRRNKCKFHGGMNTGARAPEDNERSIAALRDGWAKGELRLYSKFLLHSPHATGAK
jgi:hypothetical protein